MKKKLIISGLNTENQKKIIHNYINHNLIRNKERQTKLRNLTTQIYNNLNSDNKHDTEMYENKPYTKTQIIQSLNLLQERKVTIENIYQEKYNNIFASGFGDFLRGSYFLMQFCDQYQLSYHINIQNHPISKFLEIYQGNQTIVYPEIGIFNDTNFHPGLINNIIINKSDITINNEFIYFLSNILNHNNKIYTYIISYPNYLSISSTHKKYMQQLLKPTDYMRNKLNETLDSLDLKEKEFIIIHVRYGDSFLINGSNDINTDHLLEIYKLINPDQKILLISDNDNIKTAIQSEYPFVKTHLNKITHTGEGVTIETDSLQNTMIDLYLFSLAKSISAFSIYPHGTGFSKWIAETYSIPYVCRFLS